MHILFHYRHGFRESRIFRRLRWTDSLEPAKGWTIVSLGVTAFSLHRSPLGFAERSQSSGKSPFDLPSLAWTLDAEVCIGAAACLLPELPCRLPPEVSRFFQWDTCPTRRNSHGAFHRLHPRQPAMRQELRGCTMAKLSGWNGSHYRSDQKLTGLLVRPLNVRRSPASRQSAG